jgi:sugar O-acyltransferase (sialic acid O-acetyltransferase NeuD family)
MNNTLIIVGAGGHAKSVAEIALAAGYTIRAFISAKCETSEIMGIRVHEQLPPDLGTTSDSIAVAIGANYIRENACQELEQRLPLSRFPALIHPSAVIASNARIGPGTTIHQNSVVGVSSTIGRFCILNTSSSIDHDCVMRDFASLGPGAHTGGSVEIAERAHISIGAVVLHNCSVGADAILGAGSCALESIPDLAVSVGIPARVVKKRRPNDPYL